MHCYIIQYVTIRRGEFVIYMEMRKYVNLICTPNIKFIKTMKSNTIVLNCGQHLSREGSGKGGTTLL